MLINKYNAGPETNTTSYTYESRRQIDFTMTSSGPTNCSIASASSSSYELIFYTIPAADRAFPVKLRISSSQVDRHEMICFFTGNSTSVGSSVTYVESISTEYASGEYIYTFAPNTLDQYLLPCYGDYDSYDNLYITGIMGNRLTTNAVGWYQMPPQTMGTYEGEGTEHSLTNDNTYGIDFYHGEVSYAYQNVYLAYTDLTSVSNKSFIVEYSGSDTFEPFPGSSSDKNPPSGTKWFVCSEREPSYRPYVQVPANVVSLGSNKYKFDLPSGCKYFLVSGDNTDIHLYEADQLVGWIDGDIHRKYNSNWS